MPRNGSGSYVAPANSVNPAVATTTIDDSDFNDMLDDLETALTESIARDGQTTTTAVIPFASGVKTDTVVERSGNAGVTIDGTLIKDGTANVTTINDTNGNEVVKYGATASAVNEVTMTNAATGAGPVVEATGGDANIPVTLKGKGTGAVILGQATSTDVRLAADQPIGDSSGNELVKFTKTASAVNEITVTNAATGNKPKISATGETDVGLDVQAKGAGIIQLLDGSGNEVLKTAPAVASAINELTVSNSATGDAVTLSATGGDTDISLNLVSKGDGTLQANGLPLTWTYATMSTTTGGTSIAFTDLPEGITEIEIMVAGLSASGTDEFIFQLSDSGGFVGSGYVGRVADSVSAVNLSSSFQLNIGSAAANTYYINISLRLVNSATNLWQVEGHATNSASATFGVVIGTLALSDAITGVRIALSGSDTFDANAGVQIRYK